MTENTPPAVDEMVDYLDRSQDLAEWCGDALVTATPLVVKGHLNDAARRSSITVELGDTLIRYVGGDVDVRRYP